MMAEKFEKYNDIFLKTPKYLDPKQFYPN